MQIAEQLVKNGVTSSDAFNRTLTEFVRGRGITKVVETGTYKGTGTTTAIAEGMKEFTAARMITIEVNPDYYRQAKRNLLKYPFVKCWNGLSVGRPELPTDISFNVPDFVIVDHLPETRSQKYLSEVMYNVPDNYLEKALQHFDNKPDLVLLDSAGHMGWIEFNYLIKRAKTPFALALDDTLHVKHYDSMQYVIAHPEQFQVIWESNDKFGSALILVK